MIECLVWMICVVHLSVLNVVHLSVMLLEHLVVMHLEHLVALMFLMQLSSLWVLVRMIEHLNVMHFEYLNALGVEHLDPVVHSASPLLRPFVFFLSSPKFKNSVLKLTVTSTNFRNISAVQTIMVCFLILRVLTFLCVHASVCRTRPFQA